MEWAAPALQGCPQQLRWLQSHAVMVSYAAAAALHCWQVAALGLLGMEALAVVLHTQQGLAAVLVVCCQDVVATGPVVQPEHRAEVAAGG